MADGVGWGVRREVNDLGYLRALEGLPIVNGVGVGDHASKIIWGCQPR